MKIYLYRIMLFGHDINKLKTFYTDNFGCTVAEEIKNEWVVLNAGQMEIALHKIGQEHTTENGEGFKAESNTKLVFRIDTDLHLFRQKLLNSGVLVKDIKSFTGINSLFCDGEDFEGNIFQLEQRLG